jgi:hypothetical protein
VLGDDPNPKPGFQYVVQQFAFSGFEHMNVLLLSNAIANHLLDDLTVSTFAAN